MFDVETSEGHSTLAPVIFYFHKL